MRLALNTVPADFHKVELQHHRSGPFCVDTSSKPFSFPLRGPVRQISTASLFGECESNCGEYLEMTSEHGGVFKDVCLFVCFAGCVAVRSDYLCGVWRFSERNEPQALQVVSTSEVATCISARLVTVQRVKLMRWIFFVCVWGRM